MNDINEDKTQVKPSLVAQDEDDKTRFAAERKVTPPVDDRTRVQPVRPARNERDADKTQFSPQKKTI